MGWHSVSTHLYREHSRSYDRWAVDTQAMQPICGRLSDILGRKYVLLGTLTIFMLGSLACALAQVSAMTVLKH